MNYVGLISSSHPRIRRSEGNTLVDPKKVKKYKKEKIPNQRVGESKNTRERKFPIKDRKKKTEEIRRKVFEPDNI